MSATMSLKWSGQQILDQIRQQAAQAVDSTLADAAALAAIYAPVSTGALRNSITYKPARMQQGAIVGSFGSYTISYAIYPEMGTYKMSARPYLRPAADDTFPTLLSRLGRLG